MGEFANLGEEGVIKLGGLCVQAGGAELFDEGFGWDGRFVAVFTREVGGQPEDLVGFFEGPGVLVHD